MKTLYRVWTYDFGDKVTILSDWQSKAKCLKQIIGHWGHIPPFAFISKARTAESFRKANPHG